MAQEENISNSLALTKQQEQQQQAQQQQDQEQPHFGAAMAASSSSSLLSSSSTKQSMMMMMTTMTDAHATPQHNLTHVQLTLLIVYAILVIFWMVRTICSMFNIRAFNHYWSGFGFGGFGDSNSNSQHSNPNSNSPSSSPSSSSSSSTHVMGSISKSKSQNQGEITLHSTSSPSSSSSSSTTKVNMMMMADEDNKNGGGDGSGRTFDKFDHQSLQARGATTVQKGTIIHGHGTHQHNNSAIITVGQSGLTQNLNERHSHHHHHHHNTTTNNNNFDPSSTSDHHSSIIASLEKDDHIGDSLRNSSLSRGDNDINSIQNDNKSCSPSSSSSAGLGESSSAKKSVAASAGKGSTAVTGGGGPPAVTFDKFLNSFLLFGAIMIFFYFCDYWKAFPQGPREYSRDLFCFLVFLFFLVASAFTVKDNPDKVLNRDQTEEWKGWMQVMFVWYHYFKAAEWYNWIRVYIACYVWMTGFGNFSFFWIRKDFSLWRMLKMLFRLNFLVVFVAMVTNNEYMLYYICAMHTYWFITVYVFMRVLNSWNTDRFKMAVKFAAYAVCNAIIFDIPGVSQTIFRPFESILGYHDYNNKFDVMHEWSFRAGLDHWACFVGMLCAYNYPHFEAFMNYLDSKSVSKGEQGKKLSMRVCLGAGALLIGMLWTRTALQRDKYAYNAQHPYTSAIPILAFIVLRNIHPAIRGKHIGMFSWLGKITLETYLSQLHIYLLANARTLLLYMPDYPMLNFALATIVYLAVSNLLFNITTDVSNFLIPRDRKRLAVHIVCVVAMFGFASAAAYGVFL